MKRLPLIVLTLLMGLLFTSGLLFTYSTSQATAQRATRTPRNGGQGSGAGASLTALAATADAIGTQVNSQGQDARATADAAVNGFYGTATMIRVTADAMMTQLGGDATAIRATANAVGTQVATFVGELSDAQLEVLELLLENAALSYNQTTNTVTALTTLDEAEVNAILDVAVEEGTDYTAEQVSVDLVPDGAIFTILDAVTEGQVTLDATIYVTAGVVQEEEAVIISVTVESVTLGNQTVPLDEFSEYTTIFASVIEAQLAELQDYFDYSVDAFYITDVDMTTIVTITLAE